MAQVLKDNLAENFGGAPHRGASTAFSISEVPDLSGKVGIVTGGSEGIGYGLTHSLLSKNISKLFITSRRQETGDEALKAIEEELGADARKRVVYIHNDLSDWSETAKVASDIAKQTDRLDILINNAARGIMSRQLAPTNGVDLHMAGNVFGHIVFTSHLLPLLKKTAKANPNEKVRIVNLSSSLHASAPKETKFANLEEINKEYDPTEQYGRTKLGNLLHARYLNRHLAKEGFNNLIANATHPGIVDTAQTTDHIHDAYPLLGYGMSKVVKPFQKDQFEGAVSTLFAATVAQEGGLYICPPAQPEKSSDKGEDEELGDQLMKLSRELVADKTRPESVDKGCPFKDY